MQGSVHLNRLAGKEGCAVGKKKKDKKKDKKKNKKKGKKGKNKKK